ncbi:guanylate kinase [Terriglobus sp. RCC_193]|uniref:guanylate kinase n=1 Tax=Terriglobus sp. RCC_193 TaxID=3239218 RepID=UPI003525B638
MAGILFIISAPSGSGKSTLVGELRKYVEGLEFSVSYTTRAPRGSEEDGREYHFTTRENFERMIQEDAFLEWADVFGNYYGTARAALAHAAENNHDLLLDIDVQGALQVIERMPDAISIFILPPSPGVLETRLRNRSAAERMTDEAVIELRLRQAHGELEHVSKYRFAIVNNVLDTAAAELRAIVLQARGVASPADIALADGCRTQISPEGVHQVLEQFAAAPLPPAK